MRWLILFLITVAIIYSQLRSTLNLSTWFPRNLLNISAGFPEIYWIYQLGPRNASDMSAGLVDVSWIYFKFDNKILFLYTDACIYTHTLYVTIVDQVVPLKSVMFQDCVWRWSSSAEEIISYQTKDIFNQKHILSTNVIPTRSLCQWVSTNISCAHILASHQHLLCTYLTTGVSLLLL